jgi:hypothetical protein
VVLLTQLPRGGGAHMSVLLLSPLLSLSSISTAYSSPTRVVAFRQRQNMQPGLAELVGASGCVGVVLVWRIGATVVTSHWCWCSAMGRMAVWAGMAGEGETRTGRSHNHGRWPATLDPPRLHP